MLAIKTILHPTDFSERSDCAFRLACALARDYKAKLVVVHAATMPMVGYPDGIILTASEDFRDEARAMLQKMNADVPMERLLKEGEPVTAIVDTAKACHADVIVMGTHGWTGVTRLLLGSVAEGVLRLAPCPVLTVKMPAVAENATPEKAELEPALK